MRQWFSDFERTITPGGVAKVGMPGRIIRINDIEGGTEVSISTDISGGWAKIEAGMSSPDTIEPFKTVFLRNDGAAEIIVKGWISYGRGTDDRKKLLGDVNVTEKNSDTALAALLSLANSQRVFDPTQGEQVSIRQTVLNLVGDSGDIIYTVPAGKVLYVTESEIWGADDGDATGVKIGSSAETFTEIYDMNPGRGEASNHIRPIAVAGGQLISVTNTTAGTISKVEAGFRGVLFDASAVEAVEPMQIELQTALNGFDELSGKLSAIELAMRRLPNLEGARVCKQFTGIDKSNYAIHNVAAGKVLDLTKSIVSATGSNSIALMVNGSKIAWTQGSSGGVSCSELLRIVGPATVAATCGGYAAAWIIGYEYDA